MSKSVSKCHVIVTTVVGGLILLLTTCATVPPPRIDGPIPVVFLPLFTACAPVDHEASLVISKADSRVFSSAMVWSFPSDGRADIQFNSPLGDTVLQVSHDSNQWKVTGSVELSIVENSRGIMNVGGYDIPIKSDEIGCILSGGWPSNWLNSLSVTASNSSVRQLTGSDDLRHIVVDISVSKDGGAFRSGNIKSRAMLEWGGIFGFFRHKITITRQQENGLVSMTMTGVNGYVAEWTIANEY
jgi:hypothetical protein